MSTIIAVYNSEGCVGLCDARCYNAKHDECLCICGGHNHGVGFDKATENVYEQVGLRPDDVDKFAAEKHLDTRNLFVVDRVAVKSNRIARRMARQALIEPELPLGRR